MKAPVALLVAFLLAIAAVADAVTAREAPRARKLFTSPLVSKLLIPVLGDALAKFFERQAARLEMKSAVKSAKVAQTAADLREASRKLTDASNR